MRHWPRPKPVELSVTQAYARWASTYPPEAHNPFMQMEQRAVLELLPDVAGRAALDLACGSGRYLAHLTRRGAARAVGLDLSLPMLMRARPTTSSLAQADLCALPLPLSSFDVIVCALAVGHVPDLGLALTEMSRVLAPGGGVVYSDFHPFGSLAGWRRTFRADDGREFAVRHHVHLYADHLAACRAAGLTIEDVREPRVDFEHEWRGYPAALIIRARKV
ncbi:MAG: class I SAM-dependent methyltransferase [Anaerolineales bacterium]